MFTLQIGDFKEEYRLAQTKAPEGADYEYCLQVYGKGTPPSDERYVLIPARHWDYQTARYASFLGGAAEEVEIDSSLRWWLTDKILRRVVCA